MATDIFTRLDSTSFVAIGEVRIGANPVLGCWLLTLCVKDAIAPNWLDGLSIKLVSEDDGVVYPSTAEWCDRSGSLLTAYLWPIPGQPAKLPQPGQSVRLTPFSAVRLRSRTGTVRVYANAASRQQFLRRKI